MKRFWTFGYEATSIKDLVEATGSNRAAIYSEFGDKKGLLLACLESYRDAVVTPEFSRVESPGAGLDEITAFFEHQIASAEALGLPGPGCLIANCTTEVAPHDKDVRAFVESHLVRLSRGFAMALGRAAPSGGARARARALGDVLAVSAQGLWSYSRVVTSARPLRAQARTLLSIVGDGILQ